MTIKKQTVPYCLNVVWDETGKLKGAAFYEQDVIRDDGVIISVKQGDAQPVAVLDHKGVDVTGIIGRLGQDAIALAETKAAALDAMTAERDTEKQRADSEQSRADQLAAQLAAQQGQAASGVPQRVPTAALLLLFKRQGLTAQLDAVLAALPAEQQGDIQYLLQMPYTRRDHPMVEILRQAFGWTPEQVDTLFVEADKV